MDGNTQARGNPAMNDRGYYTLINVLRHAVTHDGVDEAFRQQVLHAALCRTTTQDGETTTCP